jgi:hypothetical protein
MKKALFGLTALVLVAGCQEYAKITSAPANARVVSTEAQEQLADGTSMVTIRTFLPGESDGKIGAELPGIECEARSDELSARVITPQQIVVPKFKQRAKFENRGVPSALVVTCATGDKMGKGQVTAIPKSTMVATGAGMAGVLVSVMASAALASATPWVYEGNLNIIMAPK